MNHTYVKKLLDLPNSVMIGSRGLGLPNWNDTDIAVLGSELPEEFLNFQKFDLTNYFRTVPMGNNLLMKLQEPIGDMFGSTISIDVLIFDSQEGIDAIHAAMNDMYSIPKYMLYNKIDRVRMYEQALQHAINNPS